MCLLSTPSNFLLSLSFYHKKEPKRFNTYHNIEKKKKRNKPIMRLRNIILNISKVVDNEIRPGYK